MFVDTPDVVSSLQLLIFLIRFLRSLFELLFNELHFTKETKKTTLKVTPYLPLFSSLKEYEYLPIKKKKKKNVYIN